MSAIIEGIISNQPETKILGNDKAYTWFILEFHHIIRPGEGERITRTLIEVRDDALMTGVRQGDRVRVYGEMEWFEQGAERKIKLIASEIARIVPLLPISLVVQQEEQGVLFV